MTVIALPVSAVTDPAPVPQVLAASGLGPSLDVARRLVTEAIDAGATPLTVYATEYSVEIHGCTSDDAALIATPLDDLTYSTKVTATDTHHRWEGRLDGITVHIRAVIAHGGAQ